MVKKRKRLGNMGIDALLSASTQTTGRTAPSQQSGLHFQDIPLDKIQPNQHQPRIQMDAEKIESLGESIRQHGLIEPIVVREVAGVRGKYELIAGERRWRAAQQAGLTHISAVIRKADDQESAVLALIENMDREDLGALEQAVALQTLIRQFSMTHERVAGLVGLSRAQVSNLIRLLDLDDQVQLLVQQQDLPMGQARVLLRLPKKAQLQAARKMVADEMTTRQAEAYVEKQLTERPARTGRAHKPAEVAHMEQQLSEHLGSPVQIQHKASGRGKIIIDYAGHEVFEGIVDKICS